MKKTIYANQNKIFYHGSIDELKSYLAIISDNFPYHKNTFTRAIKNLENISESDPRNGVLSTGLERIYFNNSFLLYLSFKDRWFPEVERKSRKADEEFLAAHPEYGLEISRK